MLASGKCEREALKRGTEEEPAWNVTRNPEDVPIPLRRDYRRKPEERSDLQDDTAPGHLCSYLPRTRMRPLDRSTILNGQLAILA
ncbi:hypothetical protein KM043_006003 [Ampulex compressa]|nr:hypothetical protein KM043_006003 [Ampulex compressa]